MRAIRRFIAWLSKIGRENRSAHPVLHWLGVAFGSICAAVWVGAAFEADYAPSWRLIVGGLGLPLSFALGYSIMMYGRFSGLKDPDAKDSDQQ
jgi:hypothetical protein